MPILVVKHRTELLNALLLHSGLHPSHPRFPALDRAANTIVSFHTFLDTYPDVVNAEWAQLTDRLENNAQFDKAAILTALKEKLLSLKIESSQQDYPHRLLSFLLASSRKVLSTVIDPAGPVRILQAAIADQHTIELELQGGAESSGDDYCAADVAYSSGDTLSEWSQDDCEAQDEEVEGEFEADGGADVSKAENSLHDTYSSLIAVEGQYSIPGVRSRSYRRSRDPLYAGSSGYYLEGRRVNGSTASNPYGGSSLSLWFASNESQGHPSRVIDPRRCFTDAELVQQVRDATRVAFLLCPQ
jgi:hypothetical protein